VALASTLALSSCQRAPQGGAAESQLIAATTAGDVGKVKALLSSGADPNKVVDIDGRQQSAWFLALRQVRAKHPEHVEIVVTMLKAGANPKAAWGTDRTGPKESFWQRFSGPSRRGGVGSQSPLSIAVANSVPAVVRALIDAGSSPHDADFALASAVEAGDVEIVHMVVDAGANVNTTAAGTTPLLAAIDTRNVALMTYLENHGAREKP
jgi:ankyrin repeat protein